MSLANELRSLPRGVRGIVHTNGLTDVISDERNRAAAVGVLRSHRVDACDHGDRAAIEEDESDPLEGEHNVQEDRIGWLIFWGTILVVLQRVASGKRDDKANQELDEYRP